MQQLTRFRSACSFAFIVCEDAREEQRQALACIQVPEGCTAEVVTVRGTAAERAALYQEAQTATQAKYKIYLAPETVILSRTFLADVLRAFSEAPDVGAFGVLGARQLLTDGVFLHAQGIVGAACGPRGKRYGGVGSAAADVDISLLGGGVLVTQVDVPWCAGFRTDAFLVMAHSIEVRRAGWRLGVLPSCVPDDVFMEVPEAPDEEDRNVFLDAYSRDLFPLVSIVIPTYRRPAYFREARASVTNQTYRNLDIFVTDNSPEEETKRVYEQEFASDARITYEHHPDFDAKGNWDRAIVYDNPVATYVNWLMDDDRFFPEKIACMMDCFLTMEGITLVTSVRQFISDKGCVLPAPDWGRPVIQNSGRIDGREAGRKILLSLSNFIGEPTTALVKKSAMHEHRLGWSGKEGKYLISDFPTWLCALSSGDLYYFTEPLSSFRSHEGQQQFSLETGLDGRICWALEIREAIARGIFLISQEDRRTSIIRWICEASLWLMNQPAEAMNHPGMKDFFTVMTGMAAALPEGSSVAFDIQTGWEKRLGKDTSHGTAFS